MHTAAFSPEVDAIGQTASYFHEPAELSTLIECAWAAGWRVAVHAQGDAAIAAVLDGYEAAATAFPSADARPRIEHAGLPLERGTERMAALNVTAVLQPSYLHDFGDEYLQSLGDHAHELQPNRAMLSRGVRLVLSSDSDVASYQPLTTIAHALSRRTLGGVVLGAHHRLTLEEALFAHTIDAAYAIGMEDQIGSLEPAKAADLTWLASDLRLTPDEEIASIDVVTTLIDGRDS